MKKLLLIVAMFLLVGCATATYQNGDVKLTVSRPIFSAVSASATSAKGDIVSINASTSAQLDQLANIALQGYAKYMTMGLAPTVQTPAAEAVK